MLSIIKFFVRALNYSDDPSKPMEPLEVWGIDINTSDPISKVTPFVVVGFAGAGEEDDSKDERCPDVVSPVVTIVICHHDKDKLIDLVDTLVKRIRDYANNAYDDDEEYHIILPFTVDKMHPSIGEAFYDWQVPAWCCSLTYKCEITLNEENE